MATYTIIKLTHLTPLHIGTGKENYDFSASDLQSDTLTAALAAIRAQMGKDGDIKEFLDSFVLSSAFPFKKDIFFLPKIQGKINVIVRNQQEQEYRKKLKKIKYIDSSVWQKLINGEQVQIDKEQLNDEFIWGKNETCKSVYKSQVNQRVSVPRMDNQDAEPFYFDWKFFNYDAGLYCITDASGELLKEITSLFTILGNSGLGTDRSIGGGKFQVETNSISITSPKDSDAIILLSLYIPNEEEISSLNLKESKYNILLRGGFISGSQEVELRHLRKKSIYMFDKGSVFKTIKPLIGKTVDLKPQWNDEKMHSVYRSGRPFYLPIKSNEL